MFENCYLVQSEDILFYVFTNIPARLTITPYKRFIVLIINSNLRLTLFALRASWCYAPLSLSGLIKYKPQDVHTHVCACMCIWDIGKVATKMSAQKPPSWLDGSRAALCTSILTSGESLIGRCFFLSGHNRTIICEYYNILPLVWTLEVKIRFYLRYFL